jgi:hypothetical protein
MPDKDRFIHTFMGMTAQHDVKLRDVVGQLDGRCEPGMIDKDDEIETLLFAKCPDKLPQAAETDRVEASHFCGGLPNGRSRIGDSNEGDSNAVSLEHSRRRKETRAALCIVEVITNHAIVYVSK